MARLLALPESGQPWPAKRKGQVVNSALPVNEVVETKMIVKVAHEVFLVFFY